MQVPGRDINSQSIELRVSHQGSLHCTNRFLTHKGDFIKYMLSDFVNVSTPDGLKYQKIVEKNEIHAHKWLMSLQI